MWIPVRCGQCFDAHISGDGTPDTYKGDWIACEISDDSIYRAECPTGHTIQAVLQCLKHELLFESGAVAMLLGFRREAITSFQVAVERFFELAVRVFLEAQSVPEAEVDGAWKALAQQSERQLGAFLSLHLATFKTPFQNIQNLVELRNKVVHKGYIPTSIETLKFGRQVFDIIEGMQLRFERELTVPFETVVRRAITSPVRQLYESREAPLPAGDKWRSPTSMWFAMVLSHAVKKTSARAFDDAIKDLESRLSVYGHRLP